MGWGNPRSIAAACIAMTLALTPARAVAQQPGCAQAASALDQARSQIAQQLPVYQQMSAEQRAAEDAAMRAELRPLIQRFSSSPDAPLVNARVRDAVGRSLVEILAATRTVSDAASAVEAIATAYRSVCEAGPPGAEEVARARSSYAFDRAAEALDRRIGAVEADLEAAQRRQAAFEEALRRSGPEAIGRGLREEAREIEGDLKTGIASTLVDIAGTALPQIEALGSGAALAVERLMLSKDKATAIAGAARFAEAAASGQPLKRSDWENAGTSLVSLMSLSAAATQAVTATAAAGTAAAVAGGLAALAGTTLAVGGIAAGFIETSILSRSHAEVTAAAQRATTGVAAYRERLANRIRIQQELLAPLRERRERLDAARERLGQGS